MRTLSISWIFLVATASFLSAATPKLPAASDARPKIELSLELKQSDEWRSVDPHTVFHSNDEIRFRVRVPFGGYLYVFDRSSAGAAAWLFPRSEEGQRSRVEPGSLYLIPGTTGSFIVGGKPGFDTTYWILSPVPMDSPGTVLPAPGSQPNTLVPRCRDGLLKARGVCEDERAGPRVIAPLASHGVSLISRDLTFKADNGRTIISTPSEKKGPIVYEFRIAHN